MSVRVVHGANVDSFPIEGMTVGQAARSLRDVFNIPADADAFVNRNEVERNHVLESDDDLEFIIVKGQKGGIQEYWSKNNVAELFGDDAIEEMTDMGIEPSRVPVYTSGQVVSWQAARSDKPHLSKHGLVVAPGQFSISYQGGKPAYFGNTILFRLIARLAKRPNFFVSINILKVEVWQDEYTADGTVSRTARRLQEKLNELEVVGITIETQPHNVRLRLH